MPKKTQAKKPRTNWSKDETKIVLNFLSKEANQAKALQDQIQAVKKLLVEASAKNNNVRATLDLATIESKIKNTKKSLAGSTKNLDEFLEAEESEDEVSEEEEEIPARKDRKRARERIRRALADEDEANDEEEEEASDEEFEQARSRPKTKPTTAKPTSLSPNKPSSSNSVYQESTRTTQEVQTRATPSAPLSLPQPAPPFAQLSISQELDDSTLGWLHAVSKALPANVLQFVQVRQLYGRLSLALCPPLGYSLSVAFNGTLSVLSVTFTLKDYSPLLEAWASFLDSQPGAPADDSRAAYPHVLPPSVPLTVFLPRHPRQNTETYPKILQPTEAMPLATVMISLLRN